LNIREGLRRAWIIALVGWEVWCLWYGYTLATAPLSPLRLQQPTRWQIIDEAVYMSLGGFVVAFVIAWVWRGLQKR
jgi:hypothetical protein